MVVGALPEARDDAQEARREARVKRGRNCVIVYFQGYLTFPSYLRNWVSDAALSNSDSLPPRLANLSKILEDVRASSDSELMPMIVVPECRVTLLLPSLIAGTGLREVGPLSAASPLML